MDQNNTRTNFKKKFLYIDIDIYLIKNIKSYQFVFWSVNNNKSQNFPFLNTT